MRHSIAVVLLLTLNGLALSQELPNRDIADYAKSALLQEGDAGQGKLLFASKRLNCGQCHSYDGTRSKAGPDLLGIGEKFGRREIIDSVLTPSAKIADGYETLTVALNSGKSVSGIIKQSTDQSLELLTSNGELIRIETNQIDTRANSAVSIMPSGVEKTISKTEFNDLIEFLVSLKQGHAADQIRQGMPRQIEELDHQVVLKPIVADAIKFDHPVWLGSIPGQSGGLVVIEHQNRRIWYLRKPASNEITQSDDGKKLFLDLGPGAPNEGRLAAIAFHPNYTTNRRYFLFDRATVNGKMFVTIVERKASADGLSDSGQPHHLILEVPQTTGGHFGGWMEFGPDGFLYISFGDSGPQEDPNGQAQNRKLLLGKIIRIDVNQRDGDQQYSIPKDNPFINDADTRPEIWAMGFRAPWRLSFDRMTGDLWVGDVGQDRYEEISIVRKGENHGWNVFEGFEPFSNTYRKASEVYTPPVFAYQRRYGPSVTGGFVYRANANSSFYGKYIFGDYESRRIFALSQEDRTLQMVRQIGIADQRIVSFGTDAEGEIYVVGYEGLVYRIDFSTTSFQ